MSSQNTSVWKSALAEHQFLSVVYVRKEKPYRRFKLACSCGMQHAILGNPSKMPGYAYGMPAGFSCPGSAGSSLCNSCYASKGRYLTKEVVAAQACRMSWVLAGLSNPAEWVSTMVAAIKETKTTYFRIHDSGDFFSPAYTRMWLAVCEALPEVKFWAPTRSYRLPWFAKFRHVAPSNLTIRPSALAFNEAPPVIDGLAAGSGAFKTGYNCPAPTQGNNCGSCRKCWTNQDEAIIYKIH